jgi:hypothetical protein
VVLRVLTVGLQQVVVDVLHGYFGARTIKSQRLQLKHDESSRCILGEGLIDAQTNLGPRRHLPTEQVRGNKFLSNVICHREPPCSNAVEKIPKSQSGCEKYRSNLKSRPPPHAPPPRLSGRPVPGPHQAKVMQP